jgi:hypothetical protein
VRQSRDRRERNPVATAAPFLTSRDEEEIRQAVSSRRGLGRQTVSIARVEDLDATRVEAACGTEEPSCPWVVFDRGDGVVDRDMQLGSDPEAALKGERMEMRRERQVGRVDEETARRI